MHRSAPPALIIACTLGVASPAAADPTASVSGTFFADYSLPTGITARVPSFNLTRAFLTGKVRFNETWSGQIQINPNAETFVGSVAGGVGTNKTEPYAALLQMAYMQADGLVPGNSTQFGMIVSPWYEYEAGFWGYRMLGIGAFPVFANGPTATTKYEPAWDAGLKTFGDMGPVRYSAAVTNGEGFRATESTGEKSIQGVLTYSPLDGLDITALGYRGNMTWTGVSGLGTTDRYGLFAGYRQTAFRLGLEGVTTYDQAPAVSGQILSGFAVVALPTVSFLPPWELVLRADQTNPNVAATTGQHLDTIAGLSFKPTKGITLVLDDQNQTTVTSAGNTNANTVAVHTQLAF